VFVPPVPPSIEVRLATAPLTTNVSLPVPPINCSTKS